MKQPTSSPKLTDSLSSRDKMEPWQRISKAQKMYKEFIKKSYPGLAQIKHLVYLKKKMDQNFEKYNKGQRPTSQDYVKGAITADKIIEYVGKIDVVKENRIFSLISRINKTLDSYLGVDKVKGEMFENIVGSSRFGDNSYMDHNDVAHGIYELISNEYASFSSKDKALLDGVEINRRVSGTYSTPEKTTGEVEFKITFSKNDYSIMAIDAAIDVGFIYIKDFSKKSGIEIKKNK